METIRNNVFETNSSSTHSITVLDGDFKFKDLFFDYEDTYGVVTVDEVFQYLVENNDYTGSLDVREITEFLDNNDLHDLFTPLNYYQERSEQDIEMTTHTSRSGDVLTIISSYGFNY